MRNTEELLKKVLFFTLVLGIFTNMFFLSSAVPWKAKYQLFGVTAHTYPGGDARAIQMAAHCVREGISYYDSDNCVTSGRLLKNLYPEGVTPQLDYPSLWVDAYSFFHDDSERFFMRFWGLNTLLLVVGIAGYSFKYNYKLLPLLLFCPIVLLAIERGNIDATTFFFVFMPLLVFPFSEAVQSFFIGFASALKIFPFCGYLSFLRYKRPFVSKGVLLGALLATPLMALSFSEIPFLAARVEKGFQSYGLSSLLLAPYLSMHEKAAYLAIIAFAIVWAVLLYLALRSRNLNDTVDRDIAALKPADLVVLITSASIFVFTFLTATNFCYQLIFLTPTLFVLSKMTSRAAKLVCLNILFVLWIPIVKYGYGLTNLGCMILAVSMSYLLIRSVIYHTRSFQKLA